MQLHGECLQLRLYRLRLPNPRAHVFHQTDPGAEPTPEFGAIDARLHVGSYILYREL